MDPTDGPLSFELEEVTRIGRERDCHIVLRSDPLVSRRHAELRLTGGEILLEDGESQNGTFVNGEPIQKASLRQGDIVRVGRTRLQLQVSPLHISRSPAEPLIEGQDFVFKRVNHDKGSSIGSISAAAFFEAIGLDGVVDINSAESSNVRRRTRAFLVLFELSQLLQRQRDPTVMVDICLDTLIEVLGAHQGLVVELDDAGRLVTLGARSTGGPQSSRPVVTLSRTVCEKVIADRCGVLTNNPTEDFHNAESMVFASTTSLLSVPMIVGDRVLGLLELTSFHPGHSFNESDLDLLSVAASMLGTTLEARRLEIQRIATIAKLEVAQRELEAAQQQLIAQHQRATLGQFAQRMAHELRNHLMAPMAMLEPLPERYPNDENLAETVEFSMVALHTIVGIVKEIQEYAATGQLEPPMLVYGDLVAVARSAVHYLKYDRDVNRVSLRLKVQPVPLVPLDESRMCQVIINLVRNAAQATSGPDRFVSVHVYPDGADAVLEVRDNGCGMGLDVACRAYEAFFTTKGTGGMGVGLEISRLLIHQHKGELTFETWPTLGTTFRVRLRPPTQCQSTES